MIVIDGHSLTLAQLEAVAVGREPVGIAPEAWTRMEASRRVVEEILRSGRVVYGVNTGFGKLSTVTIPLQATRELQVNLVRSHAAGVGEPLSEAETRAMMLARANVLAKGYSGVRPILVETLVRMLNAGIHPVVPSRGSVGASGDLAPLAHLALAMIGEGEVIYRGERRAAREALAEEGFDRVYGARPLKRTIQRRVLDPLALKILQGEIREGSEVHVAYENGEYVFRAVLVGEPVPA